MELSNMKNVVVLKNLPSNILDEAIIVFKETQKVKQKELIDQYQNFNMDEGQSKSKDYIIKEAEMLVSDYIIQIENKRKNKINKDIVNKYQKLKKYSIISTVFLIFSIIINFI